MKEITEKLIFELHKSHNGINERKIRWDYIFDTEEELIRAMFHPKVYTDEDRVPMHMWCKGYEYIKSFRKYYRLHACLTDKQMIQLKRLAVEIAFCIYCR